MAEARAAGEEPPIVQGEGEPGGQAGAEGAGEAPTAGAAGDGNAGNAAVLANTTPATIVNSGGYTELFAYLEEINGQDAYDATEAALGKLTQEKYLKVPIGFVMPDIPISKVGTSEAFGMISMDDKAKIYALNKDSFTGEGPQIRGALLRMFLCAAGWLTPTQKYEVIQATPPTNWAEIMKADLEKIRNVSNEAKRLAILLPIVSEHVFRTMGHHYLTGQAAEFEAKYSRAFAACVEPVLSSYLPAEDLYHTVGHWVSLSRALAVVRDSTQATRLPNALIIRSTAPPAGTAIITTTIAVLAALEGTGLKKSYIEAAGVDEETLTKVAMMVTKNPDEYHTIPSAYNKPVLSDGLRKELTAAKAIAIQMAPIMQGFVDSLPRGCDLAAARALSKHADANPSMRMRAKRFFQETSRTKAGSISELLNMARRANILSANDVIDDDDLDG
jgi:hypothetical protein